MKERKTSGSNGFRWSHLFKFKVRLWQVIIPACLVVLSVAGILAALGQPEQVRSRATMVSYEHKGSFNYTAYMKPSYLFGDGPQVTPAPVQPSPTKAVLSAMKYPADSVDTFQFVFSYSFTSAQEIKSVSNRCRVMAHGVDADGKRQEIELLPLTPAEGARFSLDFELPLDEKLAGGNIIIDVTVYPTVELAAGPFYESFLQQFTIRRESGMLVIDRVPGSTVNGYLGSFSYTQNGQIDYQVLIKNGTGESIIAVPPSTAAAGLPPASTSAPVELKPIGPGDPVFIKLLEKIEASFKYEMTASTPITDLTKTLGIEAQLKAGDVWSKTISLVPSAPVSGNNAIPFTIDYHGLMKLMDSIREETGGSAESYSLVYRAIVQVSGKTPYGDIRETFTPTLTVKTEGGRLTWAEQLQQSKTGKIEKEIMVANSNRVLGMTSDGLFNVSLVLALIFAAIFAFFIIMYTRNSSQPVPVIEKQILSYQKKYGDRINEAAAGVPYNSDAVIEVHSLENLVKIADEVGKPIIHSVDASSADPLHRYQVYDASVNYVYIVRGKN